jgi:hypothetical protein
VRSSDSYYIPQDTADGVHSPAFQKFLSNWFGDTRALTHGELDLAFLDELTQNEVESARALIRRNLELGCNHNHMVQGAAALGDIDAVPILRRMLDAEASQSRRLVIAGALWNLVRDPVFLACLDQAREHGGRLLAGVHLEQVLWLDDERAVDFLVSLLDQTEARNWALNRLNTLELGAQAVPPAHMPHQPEYYRSKRQDPGFRHRMTAAVRTWNRARKTGMVFGWRQPQA